MVFGDKVIAAVKPEVPVDDDDDEEEEDELDRFFFFFDFDFLALLAVSELDCLRIFRCLLDEDELLLLLLSISEESDELATAGIESLRFFPLGDLDLDFRLDFFDEVSTLIMPDYADMKSNLVLKYTRC
uniref:Uncharacterized protein n=1 Tax=Arion vulgaris TaxID=1028688 RepID=A0A0B7A3Q2_9EUPU